MMRLVKHGLMYGNLIEITSDALVARYNRALDHLIGKTTELTEFHIDISGFSPEIGDELGDMHYLNPKGCNQQFILLTMDQKTAPLLDAQFSTFRSILRDYYEDNESELFALTAREAVTGELLDSVFEIKEIGNLFSINRIDIEADTVGQHVAEAAALQDYIDQFMSEDDAWWDDQLIAKMIAIAKTTGNIHRNPIDLKVKSYTQGNFYTNLFGGVYVFRDTKVQTVIARQPGQDLYGFPTDHVFSFKDRASIANFLLRERLVEPIAAAQGEDVAAIIKQKMDFIAIAAAASAGENLSELSRPQLRQFTRKYAKNMPPEFDGLMQVWRWATGNGPLPHVMYDDPAYFYTFRASAHKERDLVNMLLSELSPLDFRQLFICHKEAFYDAYRGWADSKKDYVVRFLAEEYMIDKAGARETLFGAEPHMDGPDEIRRDNDKQGSRQRQTGASGLKRREEFKNGPSGPYVEVKWK